MCNTLTRRQFSYIAASSLAFPQFATAQSKAAIQTLHGQLDIDSFKKGAAVRLAASQKQTVFLIGEDAFMSDDAFEAEVTFDETGLIKEFTALSGQALAALKPLRNRNTKLILPNATGSIRGTGFYLNVDVLEGQNYLCCCYGHIQFASSKNGAKQELRNHYHTAVTIDEEGQFGTPPFQAPFGHYDDELVMIEAQAGRKPHWQLPDGKMQFFSPNRLPL